MDTVSTPVTRSKCVQERLVDMFRDLNAALYVYGVPAWI